MKSREKLVRSGIYQFCLPVAAAFVLALASGCGENRSASTSPSEDGAAVVDETSMQLRIAVIPKGTTHEFWKTVEAGARKAGEELGVNVTWVGPTKEDDRAQQIQVVETQILNRMDGIVLAPLDAEALRRPVQEAVEKKVPVVIFDSGLNNADDLIVSFVATDNFKGGELAGRKMSELLGGKGRVLLLRYQEGSSSTDKREEGFLAAIQEAAGIEVISSEQYGGATSAEAQQVSENLLLRFTEGDLLKVDGIFCPNESTTYGMLQALRRNRQAGKVKFVGFDASDPLLEGLKANEIHGLVLQNPFAMGFLGVKTMLQHLAGIHVNGRIDTGVEFLTMENLNSEEMQAILNPPL